MTYTLTFGGLRLLKTAASPTGRRPPPPSARPTDGQPGGQLTTARVAPLTADPST